MLLFGCGFFFGSATQQIQLLNLLLQSSSIKCAAVPLQSRVWMVISPGRRKKTSSSISSRIFHFLFPQISAILFLHLKPKAAEKKKKKKKQQKKDLHHFSNTSDYGSSTSMERMCLSKVFLLHYVILASRKIKAGCSRSFVCYSFP